MATRTSEARQSLATYWLVALAIALGLIVWFVLTDSTPSAENPITPVAETPSTTEPTPTEPVGSTTTPLPNRVTLSNAPFTSQAPNSEWSDPRQQDGCEEASVLMAGAWAHGETIGNKNEALVKILALSSMAEEMFGTYHDSSAADTLKLYREYWSTTKGTLKYDVTAGDMKRALADGNVLIIPADGKALNNPNFSGGGPDRHMLIVIGYDDKAGVFITHDPGTRNGANYRYTYSVMMNALRDYATGYHEPIPPARKAMVVIPKEV